MTDEPSAREPGSFRGFAEEFLSGAFPDASRESIAREANRIADEWDKKRETLTGKEVDYVTTHEIDPRFNDYGGQQVLDAFRAGFMAGLASVTLDAFVDAYLARLRSEQKEKN